MTLPRAYFDGLYRAAADPWSLRTRWYERRKYAITAAALPRERYADGLEVGCSVGELTAVLAPRCDRFTAWDTSAAAVERAAARNPGVAVAQRSAPGDRLPEVDLLVLSEVLYYLSPADLTALLDQVRTAVRPGGTVLAVHWRHPVADYPQTGDAVHAALAAALDWPVVAAHHEPDFLLDCRVRSAAPRDASVAAAEDLW